MKSLSLLTFITCALILSGCSGKKSSPATSTAMSSEYVKLPFEDINAESTFDPELLKDIPQTLDLKSDMTSVKDQQDRGTCSFFSVLAIAEAAVKKKMHIDINLSEEYLNYSAKSLGYSANQEGAWPLTNIYVIMEKKDGLLLERDWPYQPSWFEEKNPCIQHEAGDASAPAICYSHNKPSDAIIAKKISSDNFEGFYFKAETTNEIIETLNKYREPLVMTMPTSDEGLFDNGDIQYTEEMRLNCLARPDDCGSHAVVLTGYDLNKKVFFFKNSWGKKWGHEGYGTLPISVVDRHVRQEFGMIELKTDLQLPADHAKDYFTLKKFEIESTEKDDRSIDIRTKLSAEKAGSHTLAIDTVLYQKKTGATGSLTENNTEVFKLDGEEKEIIGSKSIGNSQLFFGDQEIDNLKWEKDADHTFKLSSKKMSLPSVKKLRSNVNNQLVLKTTLYIFTDDEGYKPLQTKFHPLNYLQYGPAL